MAGLLNIGLTGLSAAQAQLLTTSHNITNADVDGYHRQTVIQTTANPLYTGVGFFGQGTQIAAVTRAYNQYLENQVRNSETKVAQYTAYNDQISQINNLLGDSTSGLSPALQDFFAGVQEVASNPTSVASRQSLISSAQALVARFQTMDARLSEIRQGTESEIVSTVDQANIYAKAIADMNQRITLAQVGGSNVAANDLLDQRDQLISELNKLVTVSTVTETDGSISIFVGSGQALVAGGTVTQLAAVPDPNDPQRNAIALVSDNGVANILPERLLTGGTLGGLLAFRSETLDSAQNTLGLIALGIAETVNAQQALGVDLDGVLGTDFFKSPTPALTPAINTVSVSVENVSQLTAADYVLKYDGTNYTLKTTSGTNIPLTLQADGSYSGGGLNINITDPSEIPSDGLLIQPTRYAARDIAIAITDPRKVAAGDPVSVSPGNYAGTVSERITNVKTTSVAGLDSSGDGVADFGPITLSFDSTTNTFTASSGTLERYDSSTGTWVTSSSYNPSTDSAGAQFRLTGGTAPDTYTFEFTAVGAWTSGESLTFGPTEAGTADNRNAVAMGALQTTKVMLAGSNGESTATLQSVYAQMVTQVGNKAREVQVNLTAQESLLAQATDARDSLSGVNLDEEAANLIRYQQAYQASAKVMSVAQTLFDEVLSIAR